MKNLRSTPNDMDFFAVYANLRRKIIASGYFAQVVSALTEVGGIFAASLSILLPIFGSHSVYIAAVIAVIGTAVLEIGLRVVAPQMIDAILYKRWQGLHLAMSISVFILGFVLLGTSGVLSYKNSKTVVDTMVEEPELDSLAIQAAQIKYNAELSKLNRAYQVDSSEIAQRYQTRVQAEKAAYEGKLGSAKRELSNIYNRERRTGNSYATAKDRARQGIADVEAEEAAALAEITREQGEALAAIKSEYKAKADKAVGEIKTSHQTASTERDQTVSNYGGGLAYFTIVCLFIFLASVILDRIHAKGSGIKETVELSQYDVSPPAIVEAWQAFRERVQTNIRTRIASYAEKTPPAPLPSSPSELYDPTQLANITINLKIDEQQGEGDDRDNVIYIKPKRRQIGFQQASSSSGPTTNTNEHRTNDLNSNTPHNTHENSCAVKGAPADMPLPDLLQRLKMYKKRLGKHEQKKLNLERDGKHVPKRTLKAINNNKGWVEAYQARIDELQNGSNG